MGCLLSVINPVAGARSNAEAGNVDGIRSVANNPNIKDQEKARLLVDFIRLGNINAFHTLVDGGWYPSNLYAGGMFKELLSSEDRKQHLYYIFDHCPDINHTFKPTPLQAACQFGDLDLVKYLLEKGADPNVRDLFPLPGANYLHYTDPLSQAIDNDADEIVDLLLERDGIDINNGHGWALKIAIHKGNDALIDRLISKGADVNIGENTTPLIIALLTKQYTAMTMLLQTYHADPDKTPSKKQYGPYALALALGDETAQEILLEGNANKSKGIAQRNLIDYYEINALETVSSSAALFTNNFL